MVEEEYDLPANAADDDDQAPSGKGKSARRWHYELLQAEKAFRDYQERADGIDKLYANLNNLASVARDRQFQLFWANIQVLGPSIYSRPPVPVVVPRFKDRRPLYTSASELLERATDVAFQLTDIDGVMLSIRDDLNIVARGVPWVRYETKQQSDTASERVCVEHKDRKDFRHDPARKWSEVGWVAGAAYLTKREMRKRFRSVSGDAYQNAEYSVQRDDKENGAADDREKATVWEIWSKTDNKVYWVANGCNVILDESEPHLKLEGFFPCPKPAYATLQRRSLVPVPDMLFYKDQLEEINELTARIHALSQALRIRGFYPGGNDIGEAVESALSIADDRKIMIPISNWAAFGKAGGNGNLIIWLPIDVVATTISGLVNLRKAIIDDVYQIMGLSDIMRGSTEASETLGAQQLKSQYGSVRIRDKQAELVRVARDVVRIVGEIMAENFSADTLLDMSQMEFPTDADISKQVKGLEAQAKKITDEMNEAQRDPETQALIKQQPEKAQQIMQQAQGQVQQIMAQVQKLQEQPTVEAVMKLLRDQKIRPFVLDIETDSTIAPDEQAEKSARAEFVTALGQTVQQFAPVVQMMPSMAPVLGDIIKFAMAPYRVGRELEGKIDDAVDQMAAQAQQPKPDPEAEKLKAQQAKDQQQQQFDMQKLQAEQQGRSQELQMKAQIEEAKLASETQARQYEAQKRGQEHDASIARINALMEHDKVKGGLELQKLAMELDAQQQANAQRARSAEIDAASRVQAAEANAAGRQPSGNGEL